MKFSQNRRSLPSEGMGEGSAVGTAGAGASVTSEADIGWEKYFASMFNYGATLVNVFPVGIDTAEANAAFKKFLRGEKLVE